MSAGFTVSGLVSGLDTNGLVSQLMAVERLPVRTMQTQQDKVQRSIDTFTGIATRVAALQKSVAKVDGLTDFDAFVTATSSSTAVAVTTTGAAKVGSLAFSVTQLARQHQLFGADQFTSANELVGAGEVTISVGGTDHAITTSGTTTLGDLVAAVNDRGLGLTAQVVTRAPGDVRLLLTSNSTGAAATFGVASTASALTSFTEVSTAADAVLAFGAPPNQVTVQRSSNTIGDLVDGVTLRLGSTTSEPVTVTTARNLDGAVEAIRSVVSELNATIGAMSSAIAYTPGVGGGPLSGNATVRDMLDAIRRVASQPVQGLTGTYGFASSVGLQIQANGTFVLDEAKLRTALSDDFGAVTRLFAASATATDPRVAFSRATSATQAGSHTVQATQAARAAAVTGPDFAAPGASPASFTITTPSGLVVNVDPTASATAADVVAAINTALSASGVTNLLASVDASSGADRIKIAGTAHGSAASFAVDVDGDVYGLNGTHVGADVVGTIDGLAATGAGRSLRATQGSATGLEVSISAAQSEVDAAGGLLDLGSVQYSAGIGGRLSQLLKGFTEPDGAIATATASMQGRVKLYQQRIDAFERRMTVREEHLRRQFTAMEQAVSQLQSHANFFASQLGALANNR